jgi:hypothetical protein
MEKTEDRQKALSEELESLEKARAKLAVLFEMAEAMSEQGNGGIEFADEKLFFRGVQTICGEIRDALLLTHDLLFQILLEEKKGLEKAA